MTTVLDYSAGVPPAAAIRAAGHAGAVRYISPPRAAWMRGKPIWRGEVDDLRDAGLGVAAVWQYGKESNADVLRGAVGGELDAKAADLHLREVRMEKWPVFFAVDFDITLDQWNETAVHYFRAAGRVLGRERVGIYGHSRVLAWAAQDGVIGDAGGGRHLAWQTAAWSHGERAPEAVLYQRIGQVTVGGIQCDVNDVLADYWGQRPPSPAASASPVEPAAPQTPPTGAPMADNAVDIDLHHLISFGRPTPLPKKRIIVHTTENTPGTPSRNILDYQVRTQSGSYHRLVDATGQITLCNTDDWQVWATGNRGNDIALHVSCVARAAMTRDQWLAQPKMLEGVARVIAYWARTYDIPLVKLSREELGAGRHGVAGHLEAQVWGNTDHWDPGYHFPYDVVLARARDINAAAAAPKPAPAPAPAPEPTPTTNQEGPAMLNERITSLINPNVTLTVRDILALLDAYAWEQRAVMRALCARSGVDYDAVRDAAVAADRKEKP